MMSCLWRGFSDSQRDMLAWNGWRYRQCGRSNFDFFRIEFLRTRSFSAPATVEWNWRRYAISTISPSCCRRPICSPPKALASLENASSSPIVLPGPDKGTAAIERIPRRRQTSGSTRVSVSASSQRSGSEIRKHSPEKPEWTLSVEPSSGAMLSASRLADHHATGGQGDRRSAGPGKGSRGIRHCVENCFRIAAFHRCLA